MDEEEAKTSEEGGEGVEGDRQGNPTITIKMVGEDTIIKMEREEITHITGEEDITTTTIKVEEDTPVTVTVTTTKQGRPTGTRRAIVATTTIITIWDRD